jgi:hypothetical protein
MSHHPTHMSHHHTHVYVYAEFDMRIRAAYMCTDRRVTALHEHIHIHMHLHIHIHMHLHIHVRILAVYICTLYRQRHDSFI